MSDTSGKAPQPVAAELREDVRRTRHDLGATVEALAHKVDVPARAKEKADQVLDATKVKAADLAEQAQETIDKLPPSAAQRVNRILVAIGQRPGVFLAGAIMSIVLLRRVTRRRRH